MKERISQRTRNMHRDVQHGAGPVATRIQPTPTAALPAYKPLHRTLRRDPHKRRRVDQTATKGIERIDNTESTNDVERVDNTTLADDEWLVQRVIEMRKTEKLPEVKVKWEETLVPLSSLSAIVEKWASHWTKIERVGESEMSSKTPCARITWQDQWLTKDNVDPALIAEYQRSCAGNTHSDPCAGQNDSNASAVSVPVPTVAIDSLGDCENLGPSLRVDGDSNDADGHIVNGNLHGPQTENSARGMVGHSNAVKSASSGLVRTDVTTTGHTIRGRDYSARTSPEVQPTALVKARASCRQVKPSSSKRNLTALIASSSDPASLPSSYSPFSKDALDDRSVTPSGTRAYDPVRDMGRRGT